MRCQGSATQLLKKRPPFFEEIDVIMSDKPETKVVVVLSSTTFASVGTSERSSGKRRALMRAGVMRPWRETRITTRSRLSRCVGLLVCCLFLCYDWMLRSFRSAHNVSHVKKPKTKNKTTEAKMAPLICRSDYLEKLACEVFYTWLFPSNLFAFDNLSCEAKDKKTSTEKKKDNPAGCTEGNRWLF